LAELRAMATHFLAPLAAEPAQNKKAKSAKPLTVVAALEQELVDAGLKLEKDGELRKVTVVNEHRPAHEFTKFFMDETLLRQKLSSGGSVGDVPLHSAASAPMTQEFLRRGFKRLAYTPCMEFRNIPARVFSPQAGSQAPQAPAAPPVVIRTSSRFPDIKGKKAAQVLMGYFEEKVEMLEGEGEATTTEVFSPLRLWTVAARTEVPLAKGQPTRFSLACKMYVYLHENAVDVASCELPFGELRDVTHAWARGLPEKRKDDWYVQACRIYEQKQVV